jgi:tetratricopeptide (TPR) repeat protein
VENTQVPIDRENTLKKAEKLVRQGKLDAAIVEYLRVVEDQPRDWATANTLGDLYVRVGQTDQAAAQYARIAQHFMGEGFFPKAGALFKKLLKLTPDDEAAQLNLAEISQKQGLLADAKARLNAVAAKRRSRGDRSGTAEIVVLLGGLDPTDFEARNAAARTLIEMGRSDEAASRFRAIYEDLMEKERPGEAFDALRQAVELNPYDQEGRATLARAAVDAGDFEAARRFLDRATAGADPALQMALVEIELKAGRLDDARELLPAVLADDRERRQQATELAWTLIGSDPEAAFLVVEAVANAASARSEFGVAVAALQEFTSRVPRHIPALSKLIDVCVEGGLETAMYETQAELADAYLATGKAADARALAEDLVAREPWERAHLERFRRALVMLKVHDPDTVIAERLSGMQPFIATDVFAVQSAGTTEWQSSAVADATEPAVRDESQGVAAEDIAPVADEPSPTAGEDAAADPTSHLDAPAEPAGPEDDGAGNEAFAAVFGQAGGAPPSDPDADPAEEHMTLARTYIEMSMPDEAVGPLKEAFKAPRFRFEAAAALGRLHRDRSEPAPAIEWLERAASAPAPTREEGHAVLYELGVLIEESGDTSRALALFLELQADAGSYRDVAERVERLARVETGG